MAYLPALGVRFVIERLPNFLRFNQAAPAEIEAQPTDAFYKLSDEMRLAILHYLPNKAFSEMSQTCKYWHKLCEDDSVLLPKLLLLGINAPPRSGMAGAYAGYLAQTHQAQLCLEVLKKAVVKYDFRAVNFDEKEFAPYLAADPGIQAAQTKSPIEQLRVLTHFLLITCTSQLNREALVNDALADAITENSPDRVHALLNAEIGVCISPIILFQGLALAAKEGYKECLSNLLMFKKRSMHNPRYLERHAAEINCPSRSEEGEREFCIQTARQNGRADCEELLSNLT